MKKCETATIIWLQSAAQIIPALDGMHRFIADDFFKNMGRTAPGDRPQHQKPTIKPRGKQIFEINIKLGEIRVLVKQSQQVTTHRYKLGGGILCLVQTPD